MPGRAVPLERAASLDPGDAEIAASARFALARALWESGSDRVRARALALAARDVFAPGSRERAEAEAWLAAHVKLGPRAERGGRAFRTTRPL